MKNLVNFSKVVKVVLMSLLAGLFVTQAFAKSDNNYPIGERSIFSDRAVAERIKASGESCMAGDDCEGASTSGEVAAADAAPAGPEATYQGKCFGCHGTGAAGAPKVGEPGDWGPRAAKGIDTLLEHAIKGFNAMPPKGLCMDCSDDDLKAVIEYMLENSK